MPPGENFPNEQRWQQLTTIKKPLHDADQPVHTPMHHCMVIDLISSIATAGKIIVEHPVDLILINDAVLDRPSIFYLMLKSE